MPGEELHVILRFSEMREGGSERGGERERDGARGGGVVGGAGWHLLESVHVALFSRENPYTCVVD